MEITQSSHTHTTQRHLAEKSHIYDYVHNRSVVSTVSKSSQAICLFFLGFFVSHVCLWESSETFARA